MLQSVSQDAGALASLGGWPVLPRALARWPRREWLLVLGPRVCPSPLAQISALTPSSASFHAHTLDLLAQVCDTHGSRTDQTPDEPCLCTIFWDERESSRVGLSWGLWVSGTMLTPGHVAWLMRRPLLLLRAHVLPTAGPDHLLLLLLFQTQFSEKPVQDRGLVVTDLRAEDVVLEHRSYCSPKARERHFAGDVLGYVTPVSQALGWIGRSRGQGGHRGLCPHLPGLPPCRCSRREASRRSESPAKGFLGLVLHSTGRSVLSHPRGVSRALCPQREACSPFSVFYQWNSHGYDVAKVFGGKFTQISPVWLQLKRRGREMFEVTGLHDVDQGSHVAAHLCSS